MEGRSSQDCRHGNCATDEEASPGQAAPHGAPSLNGRVALASAATAPTKAQSFSVLLQTLAACQDVSGPGFPESPR